MNHRSAILVTGGAGYIGAHACRALIAAGYQPIVYDNLSTGHRAFVGGPLVVADLLDKAALARVFAEHQIAVVMHFAAARMVGEIHRRSAEILRDQRCRHVGGAGCDAHGRLSSAGVLLHWRSIWPSRQQGSAGELPLPTDQRLRRIEMHDRAHARRLPQCLRVRRVLPAQFQCRRRGCKGDIGELRENETHLIPRAMMALQGHLADFAVFGDDYDTPDGTAIPSMSPISRRRM